MFRQAGMAGLLALLMVLPAEHLMAAFCPMSIEARQQERTDCCPYTSRESDSSEDANTGNSHHGESGDAHGGQPGCNTCTDCACALVPYSGAEGPTARDATVSQNLADVPVASRSISYILSETIVRPELPRKPLPEPVPRYLAIQVLLN